MTKLYNLADNEALKVHIADNMNAYGGSFVKALAQCLYRADRLNTMKLEATFFEYVREYHPDNWSSVNAKTQIKNKLFKGLYTIDSMETLSKNINRIVK